MYQTNSIISERYGKHKALQPAQARTAVFDSSPPVLPSHIEALITGSEFWRLAKRNRYLKLIREGKLPQLEKLAELAITKKNPSHWFAAAASKAKWEQTLEFLAKLASVATEATRIAIKIGHSMNMKLVAKYIWRGVNVERWADTARERGRHPGKYFNWLCQRELGST